MYRAGDICFVLVLHLVPKRNAPVFVTNFSSFLVPVVLVLELQDWGMNRFHVFVGFVGGPLEWNAEDHIRGALFE